MNYSQWAARVGTVQAQTHRYNIKLSGPREKSLQEKSSFSSWRSSTSCDEELVARLKALGYNCEVSTHISFFINHSQEICRGGPFRQAMKLAEDVMNFLFPPADTHQHVGQRKSLEQMSKPRTWLTSFPGNSICDFNCGLALADKLQKHTVQQQR